MNNQMGFNFDSEKVETAAERKARELAEKEAAKKEVEEKKRLENELLTARVALMGKLEGLIEFDFSKIENSVAEESEEMDEEGPTEEIEEEEDFDDEE